MIWVAIMAAVPERLGDGAGEVVSAKVRKLIARGELAKLPHQNRITKCDCGWSMPVNLQLHGEGLEAALKSAGFDVATLYFSFHCPIVGCGREVSGRSAAEAARRAAGGDA